MKKHKRDCGTCINFSFTWTKYWCDAGEKWVIPTFHQPPDMWARAADKEYCEKYFKGTPNNLAY